ncbi:hypothetical protein [Holdemania massiliensis]|uniref:hypothetical protein n=1 Tax=Holdemania massiliensis TaxID=1468449 RepID=UPI0036F29213
MTKQQERDVKNQSVSLRREKKRGCGRTEIDFLSETERFFLWQNRSGFVFESWMNASLKVYK